MPKSAFGYKRAKDSPGFLLWQTTMAWQRLIKKALEPYEVSHAQFVIMAILKWFDENDYETTQVAIANWSKLDKMTVSKSLKKLVTQGYVARKEHSGDTRAKHVTLTNQGTSLICKLVPIIESIDRDFFGALSNSDEQKLISLLNTLSQVSHE